MAYDSAKQTIEDFLGNLGLASLAGDAWRMYTEEDASIEQIMLWVRGTPAYANRFPAMAELAQRGQAISESDYINYERTTQTLAQSYGLPAGMYTDSESIKNLLLNNVSATEMKDRMEIAASAAYTAPAEVRQALMDQYGLAPGDMVGYWLDPDKALPLIQRQYQAAQLRGMATMQGVKTDQAETERLAALGIDATTGYQGYGVAKSNEGLDVSLGGEKTSRGERVNAAFGDAEAERKVERVRSSRQAEYEGGSGRDVGTRGVIGLGSAARG